MNLKGQKIEYFSDIDHTKKEGEGTFLQFGVDFQEFDQDIGNSTLVLMLKDDGTIHSEHPGFVKFKNVKVVNEERALLSELVESLIHKQGPPLSDNVNTVLNKARDYLISGLFK